ncbi:MAG: hypothetical protein HC838_18205, partial [Spirulinaceae cyanobacterium RM2_2_10]|nr:hypothetical protein [Spirulinaceae cyanobacterium RM2_2_10]
NLGDRLLTGNNLPFLWWDPDTNQFVGNEEDQDIQGVNWDAPGTANNPRKRRTRVEELSDLGGTGRDQFWENKAAEEPVNDLDSVGGLRIVTTAGVYLSQNNDISTTTASRIIWPDSMPMIPPDNIATAPGGWSWQARPTAGSAWTDPKKAWLGEDYPRDGQGKYRPFLKMRASAVYHYRFDDDNDSQTPAPPIACVANYYDPTNATTAQESNAFANGITYNFVPGIDLARLNYQASLIYPNGRPVNPKLQEALAIPVATDRNLSQQAAIDSTMCALQILSVGAGGVASVGPTTTPRPGYTLPNGSIMEVSFLDARQVKATEGIYDPNKQTTAYDPLLNPLGLAEDFDLHNLAIEQREPLEIRATVIDLDKLRNSRADSGNVPEEYMLPNSGIIYATRDSALPDASDIDIDRANAATLASSLAKADSAVNVAATDYQLDITRRPDAIMLVNGDRLGRSLPGNGVSNDFLEVEKGLTLATNLPAYIKAPFNRHLSGTGTQRAEFNPNPTVTDTEFYGRVTLDPLFACRSGDTRLPGECGGAGSQNDDEWRAATVLSDAISLLSANFRPGYRNEGDYDLRNNQTDNFFDFISSAPLGLNTLGQVAPSPLNDLARLEDVDGDRVDDFADLSGILNRNDPNAAYLESYQSVEQKRIRNGFWNNNFVTNGLSSGTTFSIGNVTSYSSGASPNWNNPAFDTSPVNIAPTDSEYRNGTSTVARNSSYFNNFVTPIQRRADRFYEYLMEVCPKLPISECKASDWYITYDGSPTGAQTFRIGDLNLPADGSAGVALDQLHTLPTPAVASLAAPQLPVTTATPAVANQGQAYQRFAHRVAFLRNEGGELILAANGHPIPIGIQGGGIGEARALPIGGTGLPRDSQRNALWFRTVIDPANPTDQARTNHSYNTAGTHNLHYYWPKELSETHELLLPDVSPLKAERVQDLNTGDFFNFNNNVANLLNGASEAVVAGSPTFTENNDPADFSVCLVTRSRRDYSVDALDPGCGAVGAARGTVGQLRA